MEQQKSDNEDHAGIKMEEAEPWEPWETKLVAWSIGIGILVLGVGGYLVNALILSK